MKVTTVELHVPVARDFSYYKAQEKIEEALLDLGGGFNRVQSLGVWSDRDGRFYRETVCIYRCSVRKCSFAYVLDGLRESMQEYLRVSLECCLYLKVGDEVVLFNLRDD